MPTGLAAAASAAAGGAEPSVAKNSSRARGAATDGEGGDAIAVDGGVEGGVEGGAVNVDDDVMLLPPLLLDDGVWVWAWIGWGTLAEW